MGFRMGLRMCSKNIFVLPLVSGFCFCRALRPRRNAVGKASAWPVCQGRVPCPKVKTNGKQKSKIKNKVYTAGVLPRQRLVPIKRSCQDSNLESSDP